MTIVVVLGLLSITLALSYAMLRTQAVTASIAGNSTRTIDARQAAHAGLAKAMRAMHQADWDGVDSVITGHLSDTKSYIVTYATGDAELVAGDEDYDEYPFRVTITSVGTAVDPSNPAIQSEHTVEAVVQLVRRGIYTAPSNWHDLQQYDASTPYAVYQWGSASAPIDPPCQIEGAARFHGPVRLCDSYPPDQNRPFDGVIDEVAVYNDALSSTEIASIYLYGVLGSTLLKTAYHSYEFPTAWWMFDEPAGSATANDIVGSNDGVLAGVTAGDSGVPMIGYNNLAMRFDGRNDYVDVGTMDVYGDALTILAWFKADSFDNHSDARIISKATGYNTSDHYWKLGTTKVGGSHRLRFRLRTNGSTSELKGNGGSISLGQWVFAAAVFDGSKMYLYQDGVLVGQQGKHGTISTNSNVPVWIGDNPPGSVKTRLLRDLAAKSAGGLADQRPFTGPVHLSRSGTGDDEVSAIEDDLGCAVADISPDTQTPLTHPGSVASYRLYPGGKSYKVESLRSSIYSKSYTADPQTNPLGIFVSSGSVTLGNDVEIEGTVITSGSHSDLVVDGDRVTIIGKNLPALHDDDTAYQLPSLIVADDIKIDDAEDSRIEGMAVCWDEFEVEWGDASRSFEVIGQVLAKEFAVNGRSSWGAVSNWESLLSSYLVARAAGTLAQGITNFPDWLEAEEGLDPQPAAKFRTADSPVSYHWHDWNEAVYQPHANDEGLVWDFIRMSEE